MIGERAIGASNVVSPRVPLAEPTRNPLRPQDRVRARSKGGPVPQAAKTAQAARAIKRCNDLLSERGQVSGARLAAATLVAYRSLRPPAIDAFFDWLVAECAADSDAIRRSAELYRNDPSSSNLRNLQRATQTPRLELFRRLNLAPGGLGAVIEMRAHLLRGLGEHPAWAVIESDLDDVLRSWFNHGFLVCRRIDQQTPPAILDKLIRYEAVHQIRDRRDLLRRLESDRRCYALFHPALPDDPVIFTELALTRRMSAKVQPLLDPDAPVLDAASCTFAVFYSISNCHEGLKGFSFGNTLIRSVVEELRGEFPRLKGFATLSPIPGFRPWLTGLTGSSQGIRRQSEFASLPARLDAPDWLADRAQRAQLERELIPLCAYYLLRAKQGVEPADPVGRFHLGNGARLARINWLGDTSAAGMRRSAGITVNYVYDLANLERNHEAYSTEGRVRADRRIESLAGGVSIELNAF